MKLSALFAIGVLCAFSSVAVHAASPPQLPNSPQENTFVIDVPLRCDGKTAYYKTELSKIKPPKVVAGDKGCKTTFPEAESKIRAFDFLVLKPVQHIKSFFSISSDEMAYIVLKYEANAAKRKRLLSSDDPIEIEDYVFDTSSLADDCRDSAQRMKRVQFNGAKPNGWDATQEAMADVASRKFVFFDKRRLTNIYNELKPTQRKKMDKLLAEKNSSLLETVQALANFREAYERGMYLCASGVLTFSDEFSEGKDSDALTRIIDVKSVTLNVLELFFTALKASSKR